MHSVQGVGFTAGFTFSSVSLVLAIGLNGLLKGSIIKL